MPYALLEGWGGVRGKGDEVDLYETIMKSCVIRIRFSKLLIFSSTRGCSLEREMLTVNYLCK